MTTDPSASGRDVAEFVFRHLVLIAAIVSGATGLTAALVYLVPQSYPSSALLLVERSKSPTLRADPLGYPALSEEVIGSEIEILTSRKVAERVVDRLRLHERPIRDSWFRRVRDGLADFLDRTGLVARMERRERLIRGLPEDLRIKQPGVSNLLSVTYYGDSPEEAAEIAAAVTDAYLEVHRSIFTSNSSSFFEARLQETDRELGRVQNTLRRVTDRSGSKDLELKLRALESAYLFYSDKLTQARADEAADISLVNIRVVDYPRVTPRPRFSRLFLILAAFAGSAVLAVAAALVRQYFDHTVHSPSDVAAHLGAPVLGSVRRLGLLARRRLPGGGR